MTTNTIIAVEKEGVLRVYWRADSGALTQTAQVLVGPSEPETLGLIAADMAERFDWARVVAPVPSKARPPRAIERPIQRRKRRNADESRAAVLAALDSTPRTAAELAALVLHDAKRGQTVREMLADLSDEHPIVVTGAGGRMDPRRYALNGAHQ